MREVAPGDLIFSFVDIVIPAIGIARSYCWEKSKAGRVWACRRILEKVGWKVRVAFTRLDHHVRPKDHIEALRPLLPDRYSPLQPNGNGNQGIYLSELSRDGPRVSSALGHGGMMYAEPVILQLYGNAMDGGLSESGEDCSAGK